MKALVTGAGGQLGRALLASVPVGVEAVGLDRSQCDISDRVAVEQAFTEHRPALVINAAAYTAVDKAEEEREAAFAGNMAAPAHLAAAAAAAGARFVHVSTDFVFDGTQSTPYRPDDPVAPLGAYGQSKEAGEQAVLAALPGALIVRTAWVYAGAGKNFLVTMLRLLRERGQVRVVADQIGTPTHAASLARALWRMAETDAAGIVHYADAGTGAWYDFAIAIAEEAEAAGLLRSGTTVEPIATADFPTPARRPAFSVLDRSSGWAIGGRAQHWRVELREALKEVTN